MLKKNILCVLISLCVISVTPTINMQAAASKLPQYSHKIYTKEWQCSVCLDTLEHIDFKDIHFFPCGHTACQNDFKQLDRCPVCRSEKTNDPHLQAETDLIHRLTHHTKEQLEQISRFIDAMHPPIVVPPHRQQAHQKHAVHMLRTTLHKIHKAIAKNLPDVERLQQAPTVMMYTTLCCFIFLNSCNLLVRGTLSYDNSAINIATSLLIGFVITLAYITTS